MSDVPPFPLLLTPRCSRFDPIHHLTRSAEPFAALKSGSAAPAILPCTAAQNLVQSGMLDRMYLPPGLTELSLVYWARPMRWPPLRRSHAARHTPPAEEHFRMGAMTRPAQAQQTPRPGGGPGPMHY